MIKDNQSLALEIARDLHKDHKRSDGSPYIDHPIAVAKKVADYFTRNHSLTFFCQNHDTFIDETIQAAYLHDVLEDCPIDSKYLLDKGISQAVVDILHALNKNVYPSYSIYIEAIAANPSASIVKYYDLEHNSQDLDKCARLDKYQLAQLYLRSKCALLEYV